MTRLGDRQTLIQETDAARANGAQQGDGRSTATRSHAQRARQREDGEDGEHRTFPEVSTMAHSARPGGLGHHQPIVKKRGGE